MLRPLPPCPTSGRLAFASAVVSCGGGILPGSRTLLDFYYTADISAAVRMAPVRHPYRLIRFPGWP